MQEQRDHDLLIRIDTRLATLEEFVMDQRRDQENRLRSLERRQWINAGAIATSAAALAAVVKHSLFGGGK